MQQNHEIVLMVEIKNYKSTTNFKKVDNFLGGIFQVKVQIKMYSNLNMLIYKGWILTQSSSSKTELHFPRLVSNCHTDPC